MKPFVIGLLMAGAAQAVGTVPGNPYTAWQRSAYFMAALAQSPEIAAKFGPYRHSAPIEQIRREPDGTYWVNSNGCGVPVTGLVGYGGPGYAPVIRMTIGQMVCH